MAACASWGSSCDDTGDRMEDLEMRMPSFLMIISTTFSLTLSFRHGSTFMRRSVTNGRSFGQQQGNIYHPHYFHHHRCRHVKCMSSSGSGGGDFRGDDLTILSSLKSTTVKRMQSLLTKSKKRMEFGQTVVEGPRIIFDLLRNPQTRSLVQDVLVSSDHLEYYHRLQRLLKEHEQQQQQEQQEQQSVDQNGSTIHPSFRIQVGTPQVVQACCDTVTPQGMVATVQVPSFYYNHHDKQQDDDDNNNINNSLLSNIILDISRRPTTGSSLILILDGVSDPGNLGTLLRTSVAVGVSAVLLLPQCCDPYSPKALRSAMGTTFLLPMVSFDSWDQCYQQLVGASAHHDTSPSMIWAATMIEQGDDGDDDDDDDDQYGNGSTMLPSLPYYQVDWSNIVQSSSTSTSSSTSSTSTATATAATAFAPKALVIGGEGNGLSLPVRHALAEGTIRAVHVPMEPGIESLNAAVCGSVIMFEAYRQQQQQPQQQKQQ